RRHTRSTRDWSSDVCSSDLFVLLTLVGLVVPLRMSEPDMEEGDLAVHGHEVYPSDVPSLSFPTGAPGWAGHGPAPTGAPTGAPRSEERRVGKERRAREATKA